MRMKWNEKRYEDTATNNNIVGKSVCSGEVAHFTFKPPQHDYSVCNIERDPQSESSRMWNNSIVTSRIYLHYTFIFFSRRSVLCISHSFFCVRCCLKTIFLTISISNNVVERFSRFVDMKISKIKPQKKRK